MSSSASPDDLAVAFRSFARRAREAQGDAPDSIVAHQTAGIARDMQAAAARLHTRPDPTAIADAIQHRPADAWTDEDLDALQANALEIGRLVRSIEHVARGGEIDD
jgi:hypothetical protein